MDWWLWLYMVINKVVGYESWKITWFVEPCLTIVVTILVIHWPGYVRVSSRAPVRSTFAVPFLLSNMLNFGQHQGPSYIHAHASLQKSPGQPMRLLFVPNKSWGLAYTDPISIWVLLPRERHMWLEAALTSAGFGNVNEETSHQEVAGSMEACWNHFVTSKKLRCVCLYKVAPASGFPANNDTLGWCDTTI